MTMLSQPSSLERISEIEVLRTLSGAVQVASHRLEQMALIEEDYRLIQRLKNIGDNSSLQNGNYMASLSALKTASSGQVFSAGVQGVSQAFYHSLGVTDGPRLEWPVQSRPHVLKEKQIFPEGYHNQRKRLSVQLFVDRQGPQFGIRALQVGAVAAHQNDQMVGSRAGRYAGSLGQGIFAARAKTLKVDATQLYDPQQWPPGKIRAVSIGYYHKPEAAMMGVTGWDRPMLERGTYRETSHQFLKSKALGPFFKGFHVGIPALLSGFFLWQDLRQLRQASMDETISQQAQVYHYLTSATTVGASLMGLANFFYNGLGAYRLFKAVTTVKALSHGVLMGKISVFMGGLAALLQLASQRQASFNQDEREQSNLLYNAFFTMGAIGAATFGMGASIVAGANFLVYLGLLLPSIFLSSTRHAIKHARTATEYAMDQWQEINKQAPHSDRDQQMMDLIAKLDTRAAAFFYVGLQERHGMSVYRQFSKPALEKLYDKAFRHCNAVPLLLYGAYDQNGDPHLRKGLFRLHSDQNQKLVYHLLKDDPDLPNRLSRHARKHIAEHAKRSKASVWYDLLERK